MAQAVVGEGALGLPPFGPLAFAVVHFNLPLISRGVNLIFLIIKRQYDLDCRYQTQAVGYPLHSTGAAVRKKIRVVQFGVGPIGASIARLMRQKQSLEIEGAIDTDPEKIGKDLGEIAGAQDAPWGIKISADAEKILDGHVDAVVHSTSSYLESVMDQLTACLEAGCCIVSTCEELAYPFRKHPELAKKLDAVAQEEGAALVGTGVNPGFGMDTLALTLSAAAQRIDWLSAVRIVDASKRRLPLQKKIGAGMTPEEFQTQVAAGVIKHHGLPESIAMVADGLGF